MYCIICPKCYKEYYLNQSFEKIINKNTKCIKCNNYFVTSKKNVFKKFIQNKQIIHQNESIKKIKNSIKNYLNFKEMLCLKFVKIFYNLCLGMTIISIIILLYMRSEEILKIISPIGIMLVINVIIRVICEMKITLFKISEKIDKIYENI